MPYLNNAFLCQDCEWIGDQAKRCEKCASEAVQSLAVWINRKIEDEVTPWADAVQYHES